MEGARTPAIITVAITGAIPTKQDNPAVPVAPAEQVESAHEAFEAGATVCHIHVRDRDQRPSSDPERFAWLNEGLERHCPGMIVQFSTGGRSGAGRARGGMLRLRPDMASLSVGSNTFPTRVYENPPDLVSHIVEAARMAADGRLKSPLYVQFVMGVRNAMPADERILDFYIETLGRLAGDAQWCAAGIGPSQVILNEWSIRKGGHARTGAHHSRPAAQGRTGSVRCLTRAGHPHPGTD